MILNKPTDLNHSFNYVQSLGPWIGGNNLTLVPLFSFFLCSQICLHFLAERVTGINTMRIIHIASLVSTFKRRVRRVKLVQCSMNFRTFKNATVIYKHS